MPDPLHRLVSAASTRLAVRLSMLLFILYTLTRLVIAARLETTGWASDPLGVLGALAAGAVADSGVALLLAAGCYPLFALCARRGLRTVSCLMFGGVLLLAVFGAVAEVFFWEEFASRLNGVAVFYLMYPREVLGNLEQSFDLGLYLPPIVIASVLLGWQFRAELGAALNAPRGGRWSQATSGFVLFAGTGAALLALAPGGSSANRELNQLALNGPANMVAAALTNDSQYDGVYPGMTEERALPLLRSVVAQDNTTFLDPPGTRSIRRWVDNGDTPRRLNVIIVIEESFGSRFVDVLDNDLPQKISPNLDRLADQSLFFTNVYASGQRTVRGLEAVLTSFTPIPGISTARRPGAEGMHSLPRLMHGLGYRSAMLYGGRALFDNMGAFWEGIGFDEVLDQDDISHQSFTTAWGVSDDDLFAEAIDRMDTMTRDGQPILLGMLTVSNHRPYKFPQTKVKWDDSIGNRENTARYADQAFGDFIEKARSHAWFDDTVFVFVADHGHKVNGAAAVPLHRYRIPLLMYSPRHIAARRVDTLTAQIDFAPTLLGVLGFSYESNFFGIDIAHVPPGGGRIAVDHSFKVAYAEPGHAVVLGPDGSAGGYHFIPGEETLTPEPPDPRVDALARAVTQTAHRMFYARQYHDDPPAPKLAGLSAPRAALAAQTR